jgi:hypothetical protein
MSRGRLCHFALGIPQFAISRAATPGIAKFQLQRAKGKLIRKQVSRALG